MVKKSHGKQKALWPKTYVNLGKEAIPHLVTRRRWEGAGGGAKIARKNLFFFYAVICLRIWKESHLCVKRLVLVSIQLIKECKSIVNGLIKTIEPIRQDLITLYKLHLTKTPSSYYI